MEPTFQRYRVEVRPCVDEIGRFRYALISFDGLHRIDSLGNFQDRETAQKVGELQAFKLGQIGDKEE